MNIQRRPSSACRWPVALVAAALVMLGTTSPQGQSALTVERVTSYPMLSGTPPASPIWSPDSRHLAFLWNDQGYAFRDVWIVEASGVTPRKLTDLAQVFAARMAAPAGPSGAALKGQLDPALMQASAARSMPGIMELIWARDGQSLVFNLQGMLFRVGVDGATTRLTSAPGSRSAIALSPDGQTLSFLQDGDLWFMKATPPHDVTQMTKVGSAGTGAGPVRPATMAAGVIAYRWSPDGRHIALLQIDNRKTRKDSIPNYLTAETTVSTVYHGVPGDPDDRVDTVVLFDVASGRTQPLDIGGIRRNIGLPIMPDGNGLEWSPDSRRLLIDQVSFDTVHRWLYVADAADGSVRELWHDERPTRISPLRNAKWQSDGSAVLFVTDIDGWYHLYALSLTGGKPKLLTPGEFSVISDELPSPVWVVGATGEVFFVSSQKSPYERQVYRAPQAGGPARQVTTLDGVHVPYPAPDGGTLAVLRSNDATPTELYLVDVRTGGAERRLTHSPRKEFADRQWAKARYVTFKSTDGATVHGRILEPPNIDRSKKYPVIVGPIYRDTVKNMWRDRYALWQQYLAVEGQYIGFHVDVRGSNSYGRAFQDQFLKRYGEIDIDDLQAGVSYLKTLPYVDPERIGVWGSSYGGLMTLFALFTRPGLFKAGVAGAPASNVWHAESTHTRLGREPGEDPEWYRRGSAVNHGEKLQDRLMIIHGTQDDTVFFKDTMVLVERLQILNKDFDLVVLPSASHRWSQRDYQARFSLAKMVEFFDRHLGRGPRPAGTASQGGNKSR